MSDRPSPSQHTGTQDTSPQSTSPQNTDTQHTDTQDTSRQRTDTQRTSPQRTGLNRTFLRGVLIVAALLLCCETIASFLAPPRTHLPLPYRNVTLKQPVAMSDAGIPVVPDWLMVTPKDKQTPQRIVVCGGSGVQGTICNPFQSFPGRLQHLLESQGYNAEVLIAGIQGGDVSEEYLYLKDMLETTQPDIVIMYVGSNEYLRLRAWKDSYPEWSAESESWRNRCESFSLYRYLDWVMTRNTKPPIDTFDMNRMKDNVTPSDHKLVDKLFYDKLLAMGQACRQHNAKLILCPSVFNESVRTLLPRQRFTWTTIKAADTIGCLFFNLSDDLTTRQHLKLDNSIFIDFTHFSPYGNTCVAQAFLGYLKEQSLLQAPTTTAQLLPTRPDDIQELDYVRGMPLPNIHAYFIEEYRGQITAPNTTMPGLVQRGHVYFIRQKYAEAADFYERALKLTPDNPIIWRNYAHSLCLDRRCAQALKAYGTAYALGQAQNDPHILQDVYLRTLCEYAKSHKLLPVK